MNLKIITLFQNSSSLPKLPFRK